MRRVMFALAVFALTGAAVATAEDPKPKPEQPVQPAPKAVQPKIVLPVQPVQPRPLPLVTAARMAQLEEDFEVLEATREVKKAQVKVAEIGVRAAELGLNRLSRAAAADAVAKEEVEKAKLEVDSAKAQVEIRVAELKEIEVKVKHAKKRLDDAKLGGVRPVPVPPVRPVPVDPTPNVRLAADEMAVAELMAKIDTVSLQLEKNAINAKKADVEVAAAKAELAALKKAAELGRVQAGAFEKLEQKVREAKDAAETVAKERKALEASLAGLRAKLKELEK